MNHMLMRPSAALFPIVCLIVVLLGHDEPVSLLLLFCFALELLTLCAPDAFRNAAAREPGVRRVDRRFGGAIVQTLIGVILLLGALYFSLNPQEPRFLSTFALAASAGCIIIEHLFEERMFAIGRPIDGALLALVSNLLLAVGLFFPGAHFKFLLIMTSAAALIACVVSALALPLKSFSLAPRNYGYAPRAALQTLLYPAAAVMLTRCTEVDLIAVIAGWILWRLSRTVCRRSGDESRPLNLTLFLLTGALTIACAFFPVANPTALACLTAFVCACAVFLCPSVRLYVGLALLICGKAVGYCAFLSSSAQVAAACAFSVAAIALNLKNATRRKARA